MRLSVFISLVSGEPDWSSLPLAKVIDFKSGGVNDKLFTQAQLATNNDSLFLRLLAFEVTGSDESRISAVLCGGGQAVITVSGAGGYLSAELSESGEPPVALSADFTRIEGEDLQGIYWGYEVVVPKASLGSGLCAALSAKGAAWGNIYVIGKRCFGSLFPMPEESVTDERNMGEFSVVSY